MARSKKPRIYDKVVDLRHVPGCGCHMQPAPGQPEESAFFDSVRIARREVGRSIDPRCVVTEGEE